jgi:hypothetical protein
MKFQKSFFEGPAFLQVAEGMMSRCDAREFQLFVGIARRLWLRRNEVIHGGVFSHPNTVFKQAEEGLEAFQRQQRNIAGVPIQMGPSPSPTVECPTARLVQGELGCHCGEEFWATGVGSRYS